MYSFWFREKPQKLQVTWVTDISKCLARICGHVILSKVGIKRKDREKINLRDKKFPIFLKKERVEHDGIRMCLFNYLSLYTFAIHFLGDILVLQKCQ